MSAHSYGPSSLASPAQTESTRTGGGSAMDGRHVFDTGSTSHGGTAYTASTPGGGGYTGNTPGGSSYTGNTPGGVGGGGGGGGGDVGRSMSRGTSGQGGPTSSFASSHYRDVYGDGSSVGSRTPLGALVDVFCTVFSALPKAQYRLCTGINTDAFRDMVGCSFVCVVCFVFVLRAWFGGGIPCGVRVFRSDVCGGGCSMGSRTPQGTFLYCVVLCFFFVSCENI